MTPRSAGRQAAPLCTRPCSPAASRADGLVASCVVMMLMTPPTASAPCRDEPAPASSSIRAMSSRATGRSPLWCPVCGSLMRTPFTSTRVWPKEAPRMLMSVWDPNGPRCRTHTPGSSRRASGTDAIGRRRRSSAVTTARVRPTEPAVAGAAVPVTTTRSSTVGRGGWATARVAPAAPRATSTAVATLTRRIVPLRCDTLGVFPGRTRAVPPGPLRGSPACRVVCSPPSCSPSSWRRRCSVRREARGGSPTRTRLPGQAVGLVRRASRASPR